MSLWGPRGGQLLPKSESEGWVTGWKAANLLVHGVTHEIMFAPMYQREGVTLHKAEPYGISAAAKCQYSRHKAPHPPCSCACKCGFYAVDENHVGEALKFMRQDLKYPAVLVTDNLVLLWVGLKGSIYQGQQQGGEARVSRAAFQQVGRVYIPQRCGSPECFGKPVALGALGSGPEKKRLRDFKYLQPLCSDHAVSNSLSLEQCSKRLGVPVAWHDPLTRVQTDA